MTVGLLGGALAALANAGSALAGVTHVAVPSATALRLIASDGAGHVDVVDQSGVKSGNVYPGATLDVLDATSRQVVGTVALPGGAGLVTALAADGASHTAAVISTGSRTLTVVDTSAGAVTATLTYGAQQLPEAVAVDSDGSVLLALRAVPSQLLTIRDGAVVSTATLPSATLPSALAVDPVTHTAYVGFGASVLVVPRGASAPSATIAVPDSVAGLTLDPSSSSLYVEGVFPAARFAVIDRGTNTVVATRTVAAVPSIYGLQGLRAAVLDPTTGLLVSVNGANEWFVEGVDPQTGAVRTESASSGLGEPLAGVAVDGAGTVWTAHGGTVDVFDQQPYAPAAPDWNSGMAPTTGYRSVTLGLYAPGDTGWAPLTHLLYRVDGGQPVDLEPTATTFTATGLSQGPHTFAIGAENAAGTTWQSETQSVEPGVSGGFAAGLARPWGVATDPGSGVVYVAETGAGKLDAFDEQTGRLLGSVPVGSSPIGVAVDPTSHTVYVANDGSGTVSVVDGSTLAVTATVAVGPQPYAVAVDTSTHAAYVADYADGSVRTIRGGAVVATTSGGAAPDGIAVDPTTHVVYLASSGSNDVAALDPASGSVLWRRPVGGQPQGVAVDPVTHHVLAAVLSPATIVELDGGSGAVVASRASANGQPVAVAFDVRTATAYVLGVNAAAQAGFLTAYDGATLAVAGSTAVGSDPAAVDVDWRTNLVFATSTSDGVVTSYAGVPGTTTPLPQAIAFTAPATAAAGTTATLSATGGDSGNPVVFSVDASSGPGVCSVSGSTLTFAAGGSCVVDANQAGDATYAAAPQVQRTIAVTAADSTPPVLTVPGRTTVDATGPSGAVVTFAATATDDTDASPAVLCTPASGSRFAVGDTTVTCTATDAAGNVAKKTFVVHVRSAKEQLDAALALTAKLLAQRGHAALAPVLVELGAARLAGRGKPACLALALAEKSLKGASGRVLDADDRQELLDDVARIEDVLGC